jgi:glycosyltransferase involved in cell wall biosynthesis
MPSISCIIVSYNNGIFLKNAIISVVNQTMPVAEILVADDASTDGSRDLITSLAQEYCQITPIFRERNLGVAANKDLAIRAANSDLITTLDGDDWYTPYKIEQEFLAIQKNSGAIAYSDVRLVHSEEEQDRCLDLSEFSSLDRRQRLYWLTHQLGRIPRDMLLTKKLYLEAGGMQHSLARYEDWDFEIRLAAYPNLWIHSGVVGINYRQTSSGLSKVSPLMHAKSQYQLLMSNHELLKEHLGKQGFWFAIANVFLRGGRSVLGIRSRLRKLSTHR